MYAHALPPPIAARTVIMCTKKVLFINIISGRNSIVHNHPSCDPTPSSADIAMTHEVREAAKTLGISLHVHVVIANTGQPSCRALWLL
jgi:DNA repair protein RadC